MLRKTLVSIAVLGALCVSSSYALELGELTSQSNLDEPYRGKIELADVGSLTGKDILIRLGSESEFRQAGLAPTRVLSQLKFDVTQEQNKLFVQVTSDDPLEADELHFVLAARWPSGQVVREYKTPLNQSALVDKTKDEIVQSSSLDNNADNNVFRDAVSTSDQADAKKTLNVVKGNTLWSIADKNGASNQLTIYQTMMAIQALNQDAFYSENINLLKEGAILRLPTQEQISLFNKSISRTEVQRQHDAWVELSGKKSTNKVEKAQLNTQAKSKDASSDKEASTDTLSLASGQSLLPEDVSSSNTGDSEIVSELESSLSATQELLDKETREKNELSGKLGDLNAQFETLEKLIALKDKQMAELQQQFANAQQALQEQKNTVDQLLEADQLRREKEEAEANSLMNQIFGNPIILSMGAAILTLLGFLIGIVMRRSGGKPSETSKPKDEEFDLSSVAAPVAAVSAYSSDDEPEKIKEELPEEDPFAFDFDTDDDLDSTDLDDFEGDDLDDDSSEAEAKALESSLESETEEDAEDYMTTDDGFASFEEDIDDLPELEVELDGDSDSELEAIAEDDIPTMEIEAELELTEDVDLAEDPSPLNEDVALEEEATEEENFVSNLLEDVEQEDVDESAIFNENPSDVLASSIEESLSEASDELDEIDAPSFGESEAAEDEESSDEEEEFDFFDASGDEVATKLDLARAYMDMGDEEGARVILDDVVESGNEQQIAEAQNMIERMLPSD